MQTNLHGISPKLTGLDRNFHACIRIYHYQQLWRKALAKFTMQPLYVLRGRHGVLRVFSNVNETLNVDVCDRLYLEISFFALDGKILLQGAVDIPGMCLVPLNEVRVVAVHRPDKVAYGFPHQWMDLTSKHAGPLDEVEGAVL